MCVNPPGFYPEHVLSGPVFLSMVPQCQDSVSEIKSVYLWAAVVRCQAFGGIL